MSAEDSSNSFGGIGNKLDNSFDNTVIQAITAAIELSINTALRYDPSSLQKIANLSDILAVTITTPYIRLYFHGQTDGIAVLSYSETPATTHLSGSAIDLLSLLKQPTNLANSGVTLVGSTQLLQQWQAVLHKLDIDWEDAISSAVGDNVGDIIGPLATANVKQSVQWAQSQCEEQQRLVSEYLTEELRVIPSKPEAELLYDNIDTLKLQVDRVAARIQAIHNTLKRQDESAQ